jgi:hypothetical protein
MSNKVPEFTVAQSLYFAGRQMVMDALVPFAIDASELDRLLDLLGVEDQMWWHAQALSEDATAADAEELDPAVLVYWAVGTAVEERRAYRNRHGTNPTAVEWNRFAGAARACLQAIGGAPDSMRDHEIDLTPPQGMAPPGRGAAPTGSQPASVADDHRSAVTRGLRGVAGAIAGVVVGLFAWPLVAAIAGTGPASPYGAVGSPLGVFEQWWVWIASVVGGGATGWYLGSGSSNRR